MAKKKEEATPIEDFTERVYAQIESDFGDNVMVSGLEMAESPITIIPICPSLDMITSGGIPEGSFVGITGGEKMGKTVTALQIAANAQKPEYGFLPDNATSKTTRIPRNVFYINIEGRITSMHLKGIQGLILEKPRFNIMKSKQGKILSSQEILAQVENILKTVPGAVVILDSISCLCESREQEGGMGTETRGGGAKIFAQFLRLVNNVVPVNKSIVIGITHMYSNTSGFGASKIEKAANDWKYQVDVGLRAIKKAPWTAGDKQIGLKTTWKCTCAKLGPPNSSIETHIRFNMGLDSLYEIFNFGTAIGLIRKSGAWYYLDYLNKPEYKSIFKEDEIPKGQGGEGAYELIKSNPEWAKALENEVKKMSGALVGAGGDD